MIAFSCPRCNHGVTRHESEAGSKVACPSCGQRLQVPQSPHDKTLLGQLGDDPRNKTLIGDITTPPTTSGARPSAAHVTAAPPQADPFSFDAAPAQDSSDRKARKVTALSAVNAPATLLAIYGGFTCLLALGGILFAISNMSEASRLADRIQQGYFRGSGMEARVYANQGHYQSSVTGGLAFGIPALLIGAVVIVGAFQMKSLRSRGWALSAALITLLPCLACFAFGSPLGAMLAAEGGRELLFYNNVVMVIGSFCSVPIGVWSLVVLGNPKVKAAFYQFSRRG